MVRPSYGSRTVKKVASTQTYYLGVFLDFLFHPSPSLSVCTELGQYSHMSSSPPAFTPQLDKSTAKPSQQIPAFDLFVVGTGGGPDETNLSGWVIDHIDIYTA